MEDEWRMNGYQAHVSRVVTAISRMKIQSASHALGFISLLSFVADCDSACTRA